MSNTNLILTAHQPNYLPYCGFFHKITLADKFCIFDGVQFERKGYNNRVLIKTQQGVQWLTVPVEHGQPRIKDARIVESGWRRKHVRAIELAYQKAPYFDVYMPEIRRLIVEPCRYLADFNRFLLYFLLGALGISKQIVVASDYRFNGSKSEAVLDMCRQLGATQYIFGSQGRDYADVEAFGRAGILLQFQDYKHPVYPQLHGDFVAGLSVIDLLFNCGPDSLRILTSGQ